MSKSITQKHIPHRRVLGLLIVPILLLTILPAQTASTPDFDAAGATTGSIIPTSATPAPPDWITAAPSIVNHPSQAQKAGAELAGLDDKVALSLNGQPQNEVTIATQPLSDSVVFAGANDYRGGDSKCGLYRSGNGGTTWTDFGVLALPTTPTGITVGSDPYLAWGRGTRAFYACLGFHRISSTSTDLGTVYVVILSSSGATLSLPIVVAAGTAGATGVFNDKEHIAVDTNTRSPFRDNIYVSWTRFDAGVSTGIRFSRSTNGGTVWSAPISLSTTGQGSYVVVGPLGEVYVFWREGGSACGAPPCTIFKVSKSVNGGVSFAASVTISDQDSSSSGLFGASCGPYRINDFPSAYTDRFGGLYLVMTARAFAAPSENHIFMRRSLDGGSTWLPVALVNTDPIGGGKQHFFPTVIISDRIDATQPLDATSNHGIMHVFYYSTLADTPNFRVYASHSHDFWNAAVTPSFSMISVADVASSASCSDFFGGTFIGDYIHSSVGKGSGSARVDWMDTRDQATESQNVYSDNVSPA